MSHMIASMFSSMFLIIFLFLVLIIPFAIVYLIIRAFTRRRDEMKPTGEEEDRFQRMWESLEKMEERITNLETILLERDRTGSER